MTARWMYREKGLAHKINTYKPSEKSIQKRALIYLTQLKRTEWILDGNIFNHLTYRRWNSQIKYNFYSNQLSEPKEDSLQVMNITSNLQGEMIPMAYSCLFSHEWYNSLGLFVPKYFQKQILLKQILRSGRTMSKEER
jgi:hypothetical protein